MATGQAGWVKSIEEGLAAVAAHHGLAVSILLALLCTLMGLAIFAARLSRPTGPRLPARPAVLGGGPGVSAVSRLVSHRSQLRSAAGHVGGMLLAVDRSRKPLDIQAMWPPRDLDHAQYVR
jgi:hypothetical protein